ncbi:MFS transporter [Tabrizicola sp.]|uniref:MFS transporter n=1 Tax=Tabrizicola sp. TaxID=2005166 RepID=UPI003D2E31A4
MSFLPLLILSRPAMAAFAAMGILWGSFAAALPDLKAMLGVDEAQMGLLMFMTPAAAVVAMLIAPALGVAFGRVALPVATLLMCAGFFLPGQASVIWMFPLAMMAAGFGTGLTDVLMNARVAAMESQRGLHLMNLAHAAYSFGYAGGSIVTGMMRQAGWSPAWVLGSMAALAALMALMTLERDGRIDGLARPKTAAGRGLGWVPVIGGGIVFIAFLTENAAENWSALHIEQTLGGSPAHGAMGPATLALTMGVARLVGQGLAGRVRPVVLLTSGALISAVGAFAVAAAVAPWMAYAGFIVMGIGSSVIAPTAFSLVGSHAAPEARARAVARATLFGYLGYFIGPPGFGFIAGSLGLRYAFVFAAVILLLVPILARIMARRG